MLQALLKTTLQVRYRITGQFPISHSLIKASRDVCHVLFATLRRILCDADITDKRKLKEA